MKQPIKDFQRDEYGDWVAVLMCGHFIHVRHRPPWVNRRWVLTSEGRESMLGQELNCIKCDRGEPADLTRHN